MPKAMPDRSKETPEVVWECASVVGAKPKLP